MVRSDDDRKLNSQAGEDQGLDRREQPWRSAHPVLCRARGAIDANGAGRGQSGAREDRHDFSTRQDHHGRLRSAQLDLCVAAVRRTDAHTDYYTCGPDEVRAWTVRAGSLAPQAAGVIHTDFENKFICGEIFNISHLKEHGTEAEVKAKGLIRQQGKTYEVKGGARIGLRLSLTLGKVTYASGKAVSRSKADLLRCPLPRRTSALPAGRLRDSVALRGSFCNATPPVRSRQRRSGRMGDSRDRAGNEL